MGGLGRGLLVGSSVCVPPSLGPPGCVRLPAGVAVDVPGKGGRPGTLLQVPGAPQDGLPVTPHVLPLRSHQTGVHGDGTGHRPAAPPGASSLSSPVTIASVSLFFSLLVV